MHNTLYVEIFEDTQITGSASEKSLAKLLQLLINLLNHLFMHIQTEKNVLMIVLE